MSQKNKIFKLLYNNFLKNSIFKKINFSMCSGKLI